jgi:excisionase family DNA binding protein
MASPHKLEVVPPVSLAEKLLLSIPEVCRLTGLSRTTVYELIATGQLKSKAIELESGKRGRRMVRRSDLEAFCKR